MGEASPPLPGWVPVEESVQREAIGLDYPRWHFQSFARKRDRMRAWAASPDGPEVLLFRHPRELEAWVASLEG